jgi:hypothetical protein
LWRFNDHKNSKTYRKHKYEVGEKRLVAFGLGMRKKEMFQDAYIMTHTIKEKWAFAIIFGHLNFFNPSHALVHVAYAYSKTWDLDLEIPILDLVNG